MYGVVSTKIFNAIIYQTKVVLAWKFPDLWYTLTIKFGGYVVITLKTVLWFCLFLSALQGAHYMTNAMFSAREALAPPAHRFNIPPAPVDPMCELYLVMILQAEDVVSWKKPCLYWCSLQSCIYPLGIIPTHSCVTVFFSHEQLLLYFLFSYSSEFLWWLPSLAWSAWPHWCRPKCYCGCSQCVRPSQYVPCPYSSPSALQPGQLTPPLNNLTSYMHLYPGI